MNDSKSEQFPLDMRKTGKFVIDRSSRFDALYDADGNFDQKFLSNIETIIVDTPLSSPFTGSFAFHEMFIPVETEGSDRNVAVKIFKPERLNNMLTPTGSYDEEGLKKLFYSKDFVIFAGNKRYEDLNTEDMNFLKLASVHKRYEELFGEFVLPSVFLAFTAKRDIITEDTSYNFPGSLIKKQGKLTSDGRRILYKAGETVYAMIQDFEKLNGPVHFMKPSQLSPSQVAQIRLFVDRVEKVYKQYGYSPDPGIGYFHDLFFNENGNLIMVDTNLLQKRLTAKGAEDTSMNSMYYQAIKDLKTHILG